MNPTAADWAWAAGFLEGEGCFSCDTAPRISANQVGREPLDRLASIVGGRVCGPYDGKGVRQDYYTWSLRARNSIIDALEHLRPWLSTRRIDAYERALALWRNPDGSYKRARPCGERTHCPKGHPYSGDNLYTQPDGQRVCRTCVADRRRRRKGQSARKVYL